MIVVSDTSPLNYLIILRADGLMPRVLGDIVIRIYRDRPQP